MGGDSLKIFEVFKLKKEKLDVFKGERRKKFRRKNRKCVENIDIRKYFTSLGENLAKNLGINPALAFNCPESAKIQMEPLNDLWQGGEKTKIEKFGTKITFKRGRTLLSEEEREQD